MKLGIMQPYLFPYIGYFQLINYVDSFVLFDDTQFINKGWVNRNRILHPDKSKGWQYFTASTSGNRSFTDINKIELKNVELFFSQLLGKLTAFAKAPYYSLIVELINSLKNELNQDSNLFDLNLVSLNKTCDLLKIKTPFQISSNLEYDRGAINHPGSWALEISKALKAKTYINPIEGNELFIKKEFTSLEIGLEFIKTNAIEYNQRRENFESLLSILDVILWNGPEEAKKLIDKEFQIVGI